MRYRLVTLSSPDFWVAVLHGWLSSLARPAFVSSQSSTLPGGGAGEGVVHEPRKEMSEKIASVAS